MQMFFDIPRNFTKVSEKVLSIDCFVKTVFGEEGI